MMKAGEQVSDRRRAARRLAQIGVGLALTTGCAVPRREAKLPENDVAYVAVLSGEMPTGIEHVARHSWIIAHVPGQNALRKWDLEGGGTTNFPYAYFSDGDVAIHGIVYGSREEIEKTAKCFDVSTQGYRTRHPTYNPLPGPNSNTIIAEALRDCGVHVELPGTAIGRDYRGIVGAGVTEAGTGVSLETWPAGVRLGLQEGVEAHLMGLPLGVHFYPPGITVPVNPGRIGIDGDSHFTTPRRHRFDETSDDNFPFEYGIVFAHMFASLARVREPSAARGLAERATVGLDGRMLLTFKQPVGYAMGADLELGGGVPASFVYAARLYPVGFGVPFSDTSYIAVFGGAGASGATERVTGGLELPVEVRAEFDASRHARVGLHGAVAWLPWVDSRQREWSAGVFTRLGPTIRRGTDHEIWGRGLFFGFERHEVMGTYWLGVTVGAESVDGT